MRRMFVLALAVVLVGAVPGFALERDFAWECHDKVALTRTTTAKVFNWRTDLFGNVNVRGLNIGLDGDVTFDSETRPGLTVTHSLSDTSNLVLKFNTFEHTGRIGRTVRFDNRDYQVGANIEIRNEWFDLAWSHNLRFWGNEGSDVCRRRGGFIDGLLGIKFNQAELTVVGFETLTNASVRGDWSRSFPLPYIGVSGGSQVTRTLWVGGHFKFLGARQGDRTVRSHEFEGNAALRLNPKGRGTQVFAILGYRTFHINGASGDDEINFGYRGPVFGLLGRF